MQRRLLGICRLGSLLRPWMDRSSACTVCSISNLSPVSEPLVCRSETAAISDVATTSAVALGLTCMSKYRNDGVHGKADRVCHLSLCSWCCTPCALTQESEELLLEEKSLGGRA